MVSQAELRDRVARFISGSMSLNDFEDWFVASSWNVHQQADVEVQRLVGAIELALAEYSNDHRTEGEVRTLLQSLVLPQEGGTTPALAAGVPVVHVCTVQGVGQILLSPFTSSNLITKLASVASTSQPPPPVCVVAEDPVPA